MPYRELLIASKTVSGLLEIHAKHEGICKGCAQGKNAKKTFPNSEIKAKGIMEIVHSDVCRPMSSSSLRRYVYYVSFIDDFSRKTWIYFLKGKNEVFSKFKEYKSLVENQNEKNTFPSNEIKAKGILDIVHLDVCGPMSSSSLRGYVYYVSFIDDFSCNTCIFY